MKRLLLPILFLIIYHQNLFSQTTVTWGVNNSRTDTRNDAGLRGDAGALSGFYQATTPVNFPTGASNWWHLLDVRHDNPLNNYAMQFAGSFFDQNLYFRKTHDQATRPWSRVLLETNGKVGIGTVNPYVTLEIDTRKEWTDASFIRLRGSTLSPLMHNMTISKRASWYLHQYETFDYNFDRASYAWNGTQLSLAGDGTVGIGGGLIIKDQGGYGIGGSIMPGYDGLVTSGGNKHTIIAGQEVRINAPFLLAKKIKVSIKEVDWADYVFASNYNLRSLTSVENFIKKYKHLPDVPSAEEVEKNDLDLGATQAVLLKKIEELTLYMIQQDKVNRKQQEIITNQQKMLESLTKEIKRKMISKLNL